MLNFQKLGNSKYVYFAQLKVKNFKAKSIRAFPPAASNQLFNIMDFQLYISTTLNKGKRKLSVQATYWYTI